MAKSTAKSRRKKPAKPHADFPLFPHANGQWCKKIRGKQHYFGLWEDPDAALHKWLDEKDDLLAGRTPREKTIEGVTLKAIFDRFLTEKQDRVESGELSPRSLKDYFAVCQFIADTFGKDRLATDVTPEDFATLRRTFAKVHGPHRLSKDITITRMAYKYAYDSGLLETPVRFGPNFKSPVKRAMRKAKRANGTKDFDANEVRRLLDAAIGQLRTMILLGANCGYGQSDCANLQRSNVDLDAALIDYPRPKTEVDRTCPLWPETVQALRESLESRPNAKYDADAGCVFITKYGNRWVRMTDNPDPAKRAALDSVAQQMGKLVKSLGINGKRNFYSLRHTFETVAGESRDQVAVDRIMGHADNSMAANYRHRISNARLVDVVNVVREWLWPDDVEADANR